MFTVWTVYDNAFINRSTGQNLTNFYDFFYDKTGVPAWTGPFSPHTGTSANALTNGKTVSIFYIYK